MLKRWWLLPIYLGVPAGLLTGGYLCRQTPQCLLYAHSHFYRLLLPLLTRQVDTYTLIFTGILAALLLAIVVANRCAGAVRIVLRIVLPLAVLGVAGKLFLPGRCWAVMISTLGDPAFQLWIRVALGIGLLGAFYWFRSRRSSPVVSAAVVAPVCCSRPAGRIVSLTLHGVAWLCPLLFLSLNCAVGAYWAQATIMPRRQPNIILVMVCSLRADHVRCYGYDLHTTPHLDQFAREGTRFARAVAPSSWTLWSTAAILTSRYPERIFNGTDIMAQYSLYPGLPSALANLGYTTCAVSDHAFFMGEASDPFSYNFRQGFAYYDLTGRGFEVKAAPKVTAIALQRARQLKGRPFFLYMMYGDLHVPYRRHKGFEFGPSRQDKLGPQWASSLPASVRQDGLGNRGLMSSYDANNKLRWESRDGLLASYNSGIGFTDQAIGELFAGLKTLGLYDDSLIIFCGDHGEEFLEHGSYGHMHTLYHEVVDVPLLVKFPRQRAGTVVGGRFSLIDLYPSIMGMLHEDCSHLGIQGDSVDLPALLRCTDKPIFGATIHDARSVLSGQYKYYQMSAASLSNQHDWGVFAPASRTATQLFDLRKDPGEYRSLLPAQPGVASSLTGILRQHDAYLQKTDTQAGPAQSFSSSEKEQLQQRLRALGYAQE